MLLIVGAIQRRPHLHCRECRTGRVHYRCPWLVKIVGLTSVPQQCRPWSDLCAAAAANCMPGQHFCRLARWSDCTKQTVGYVAIGLLSICPLLKWWRSQKEILPKLSLLAKAILAVGLPARNALQECIFSIAGLTLQAKLMSPNKLK